MKVLVVEDEALLRHHLQTRLSESGHVVDAVPNAEEALFQTHEFNMTWPSSISACRASAGWT